jgi:hypothetical protein
MDLFSKDLLSKRIELFANVAIIAIAALLGFVLIKNYLIKTAETKAEYSQYSIEPRNRTKISLADIDWQKNGQTLVMAVSSTCHFCTESGSFYQQLAKAHDGTRLVAVLPQSVDEGKRYLAMLGVSVDEVKEATLASIDVRGTPTLMMVNSDGVVVNKWEGKLESEQEREVLSRIKGNPNN